MLGYFHQGIVPTSDQLETDLEAYMTKHPNLEDPTSKQKDWSVEPGKISSASEIHDIADTISQDVGMVTREIYRIAKDSSRFYDRWSNEMKRLSALARQLEQRTDSLLLLNNNTMGFFAYVGDVFADMSQIDTDETDARVDLHETAVTINPAVTALSAAGSLIDLSHVTESDVSFQALNKKPGIAYMTMGDGNILSNVFKTQNSTWVGKIVSDSSGEMICELKTQLGNEDFDVSRIAVQFTGPLGTSNSTVTCMYSADGYTWNLVPSAAPTKTVTSNTAWVFPLTTMRWFKLIFRKTAPDDIDNSYVFSISYIRLYGNEYDNSVGTTFVSSPLQALNAEGDPILFSLLALDTCQELVNNTGINFSISASQDNTTWTNWMLISPSDSEEILYPKIINLSGADWKDNTDEDDTTLLDDTVTLDGNAQRKITTVFSNTVLGDHLLGYRFRSSNYGAVNTAVTVNTGEDPDSVGSSMVVWRNVRYKNPLEYPDILTVRNNPRGWGFDGGEYSCYFEIVDSNGKTIDFGDKACTIDGAKISGAIIISAGIHKFTTKADNWHDVAQDYLALLSGVTSQEILESIDPLYPYNHKLLIEGFPYLTGSGYQGERIYTGTSTSAEFYATRSSLFDLENNLLDENQYGHFSIRSVGDDTYPTISVVVRFDVNNSDYTNELFTIKWRSGATDTSMYKYVKLKAEFWTTDSKTSAVLTSYRLKLGI